MPGEDDDVAVTGEAVYTAFGERIGGSLSGPEDRYGYAGAWGYQTAASDVPGDPYTADFPYLHVGHRYYDPATGRFLQRDPIGIRGGLNVYVYVRHGPTIGIDPEGLQEVEGEDAPNDPVVCCPRPPIPRPKPKPPETPAEELARIRRRLSLLAALYAACAALTPPPFREAFGVGPAAAAAGAAAY